MSSGSATRTDAVRDALLAWVRYRTDNKTCVVCLYDLTDGKSLNVLVECVTEMKRFDWIDPPKSKRDKKQNLKAVLGFLKNSEINTCGLDANAILKEDLRALKLLENIFLFDLKKKVLSFKHFRPRSTSAYQMFTEFINTYLYPKLQVHNLTDYFASGIALGLLVETLNPECGLNASNWRDGMDENLANIRRAMEAASEVGFYSWIDPVDMSLEKMTQLGNTLYLSQLLDIVTERLENQNSVSAGGRKILRTRSVLQVRKSGVFPPGHMSLATFETSASQEDYIHTQPNPFPQRGHLSTPAGGIDGEVSVGESYADITLPPSDLRDISTPRNDPAACQPKQAADGTGGSRATKSVTFGVTDSRYVKNNRPLPSPASSVGHLRQNGGQQLYQNDTVASKSTLTSSRESGFSERASMFSNSTEEAFLSRLNGSLVDKWISVSDRILVHGQLKICQRLEFGTSSATYKARFGQLEGGYRHVVVKTIDHDVDSTDNLEKMLNEIDILKYINHKNIVRMESVNIHDNRLHMIMAEDCGTTTLRTYLQENDAVPYKQKKKWVLDIASAGEYLHNHNIIYRVLTTNHCLLSKDGSIQLYDIECRDVADAHYTIRNWEMNERWYMYLPPEMLENPDGQIADFSTDVHSFAVVKLEIFHDGRHPFENIDSKQQLINLYREQKSSNANLASLRISDNDSMNKLVLQCIDQEPRRRPTFSQIVDRLKAPELGTSRPTRQTTRHYSNVPLETEKSDSMNYYSDVKDKT